MLLYAMIVFFPTVLLAAVAGYYALQSVRSNYEVMIDEAIRQMGQNIEFRKQSYDLLVERTATDGELISRLSRTHQTMNEQLETVQYIDRSFQFMSQYLPGIRYFRIYHTNDTLVQDGALLWKPEKRMLGAKQEMEWYEERLADSKPLLWSNDIEGSGGIVVSRKIMSAYGTAYGTAYGMVYLQLDYPSVFGDLLHQPFDGAGELYVLNETNQIIASSDAKEIGRSVQDSRLNPMWTEEGLTSVDLDQRYKLRPLAQGWHVAAVIHTQQLEGKSKQIWLSVAGGVMFFLLLSTFLILTVLKNVVMRIRKLGRRMHDISQGEFDVTVMNRNNDELGELEVLFNLMSGRLGKLVQAITQSKLKEREQSFQALQAQINPHFIYNSLSLVRWRAMDLGDETQLRTIDALITFYRLALHNKVNHCRISDELDHVRAYMEIQNLRYPGRVMMEWEVDDTLLGYYTIKLLLQPIVENIYQHGNIVKAPEALIRIAIEQHGDYVRFEVFDTGRGMSPEHLLAVREGKRVGNGNGYGMANIRERLALYFGDRAWLEIDSEQDGWTMVAVMIPICEEPPKLAREG